MEMSELISKAERNIRQALRDYGAHVYDSDVLEDVSSEFIGRLARDSVEAKMDLRRLFSQSPVWCEDIDALVINGTRTHNPDYDRIRGLARKILRPALTKASLDSDNSLYADLEMAIEFFADPDNLNPDNLTAAINRIAPKAYAPGKKLSRVFKAICTKLGVADDTAGSEFQRLYAQFADELTAKKIGFKMYVSINPAHFLTMSNPKCDHRGNTLTSCHSFNSTEYDYNNGCSGYARDAYTFIVFTVDDPTNPETLNNRKTSRQIFVYKPGNGVLLQSRMYNTAGGVYGAAEDSKLYRDLVQREISMLENMPNLWKTSRFYGNREFEREIVCGDGFGGYPDWIYENFDAHVSIRNDHADDWEGFEIGTRGLCICCGDETSHGVYCKDCEPGRNYCEECEEYVRGETFEVHDGHGHTLMVCEDCRDEHYTYCERCREYWPNDMVSSTGDGDNVCDSCRDEYYEECEECGELYRRDDMYLVHDSYGGEVWVCEDCIDKYVRCEKCGEYYPAEDTITVYNESGDPRQVCEDCVDKYEECPHCGERIVIRDDGTCPVCGAVIDDEEKEDEAV